jgi:putative spermidine/putrescine transport system ATP-binding protein
VPTQLLGALRSKKIRGTEEAAHSYPALAQTEKGTALAKLTETAPSRAGESVPPRDVSFFAVRGIGKSYESQPVLRDITLSIGEGELVCLLGPSGCGKSTLLNIIGGIISPDSGVVELDGTDITRASIQKRRIGFVFQSYSLFPHMTARENIGYGLRYRKVRGAELDRRVDELVAMIGLTGRDGRRPLQMSGGEQQRVALARALAVDPALMLLDEPFSNLDASLRQGMRAELKRIQRDSRVTSLMVTHDQAEAFQIADRIALMQGGYLIQVAPPLELYQRPRNPFAARFTGDANVFVGQVKGSGADSVMSYAGGRLPVPPESVAGGRAAFVVRPECVRFLGDGQISDARLSVVIRDIQHFGSGQKLVMSALDTSETVLAWSSADANHGSIGDTVTVGWSAADIFILPEPGDES